MKTWLGEKMEAVLEGRHEGIGEREGKRKKIGEGTEMKTRKEGKEDGGSLERENGARQMWFPCQLLMSRCSEEPDTSA